MVPDLRVTAAWRALPWLAANVMLVLSLLFTFEEAEGQLARDRTSIQTQVPTELPKQRQ